MLLCLNCGISLLRWNSFAGCFKIFRFCLPGAPRYFMAVAPRYFVAVAVAQRYFVAVSVA